MVDLMISVAEVNFVGRVGILSVSSDDKYNTEDSLDWGKVIGLAGIWLRIVWGDIVAYANTTINEKNLRCSAFNNWLLNFALCRALKLTERATQTAAHEKPFLYCMLTYLFLLYGELFVMFTCVYHICLCWNLCFVFF